MPPPNVPPSGDRPATISAGPPALRQRDPPVFAGTGTQDVEEWLDAFERTSRYNHWDDTLKLNNVIFYLADLAKTWYTNHETELTSWGSFRTRVVELFGRPASRKANAQSLLARKVQLPDESYTSYIEDVLSLCAKVDPNMPENEKVGHVRKGIADDAFHLFLFKSPTTVEEVVTMCRELQDARNARVRPLSPDSFAISLGADKIEDLRALIRQLIHEELNKVDPICSAKLSPSAAVAPSLQAVVREEIATALTLPTASPVARPTYADIVRRPCIMQQATAEEATVAPVAPYGSPPLQPPWVPNSRYPRRLESRTCFFCGIRGHIARNCRKRFRQISTMTTPNYWRTSSAAGPPGPFPTDYDSYYSEWDTGRSEPRATYHSSRRRSLSPQERQPRNSPVRGRMRSPARTGNT